MDWNTIVTGFFSSPSQLGLGGIVTFGIVGIWRGFIVPRRHLDDTRKDRDARLAEVKEACEAMVASVRASEAARVQDKQAQLDDALAQAEKWRTAYIETDKVVMSLLSHTTDMNEVARTAEHVLKSLPQPQGQEH